MTPLGSIVENTEPLYIGLDMPGDDEYLNGDMDEVRIYKRSLSAAEVRALANGNRPIAYMIGENAWVYCYDVAGGVGMVQAGFGQLPSNLEIPDVVDGNAVVAIGRYGFADNGDIENVAIPASITEIGACAFTGCTSLVCVTLSNRIGTLNVGDNAFDATTDVAIADKDGYLFVGWRNDAGRLMSDPFHSGEPITVTPVWRKIETAIVEGRTWTYFVADDEATIGIGTSAVSPAPDGDVVIPAEIDGYPVTGIASNAFKDCVGMTSLTISSNVTSVGIGAFDGCSSLTNLVIESEALYTPGLLQTKFDTRFDTTSTLGDATNAIASVSGAIAAYSKVTAEPWGFDDPLTGNVYVWNENNSTFAYVGQMYLEAGKTYVFGTHFDDDAYVNVDGHALVSAHYHDGTTADIFNHTVYNASYMCVSSGWYNVDFRLSDVGGGKGSWGNVWSGDFGAGYRDDGSANTVQSGWSRLLDSGDGSLFRFKGASFAGCSNLVSVTMPLSLVTTMAAAFPDAYGKLESVKLTGDAAAIPEKAFARCASLKSVTMPAETTGIGANAFWGCVSLSSITLPREIGSLALGADVCDAATTVEIELTDGYYFGGWTNVTEVIISDPFHFPVAVMVSPRWMITGAEYDEHLIFFEDFEREAMEFELCTIGTFSNPACIQDSMGIGDSRGFGFGRSSSTGSAHLNYVNTLTASFGDRYYITRIVFDEMERYGNWGSRGSIGINCRKGELLPEIDDFGKMPVNDKVADIEYRHRDFEIGMIATNVSFQVSDITSGSELFIDNVKIYGRLARQCTVVFDANGGTGTMAGQTILEGDDLMLAYNVFVRNGCQFMGWAESPSCEVAFADGETIANVGAAADGTVLYAVWKLCAPDIVPAGAVTFPNASQTVTITSDAADATILYTTDGSDPLTNGLEYKRPFSVYNSCTVRAVAVADGVIRSDETTSVLTRGESLSGAANLYGFTMETDSGAPWTVVTDVSHDGVSSVRSGAIGNNGMTYLLASVRKAGTVTFWWRAACEAADEEEGEDGYYDYGAFIVDDVVVARIAGHDGGWHYVSHEIAKGGKHTLKWEYSKDGSTSYQPDCIWLDQVQWIPADGSGHTLTTPEPVPYSWFDEYGLGAGTDYETAGNAASGKADGMGKPLSVWQDYVAGTDPTNATSRFTAKIEMVDGAPVVTWEPNLNTNGVIRTYKVFGKENLSDPFWSCPTNSLHRFFKVSVELP